MKYECELRCWDYMNCPEYLKKKCPAYQILSGIDGKKLHCWDIDDAKKFCKHLGQDDCKECKWFKHNMN